MIKNYLLVALRNILKHRGFSIINITGLSVGIACCIVIFLYVQYELSYDRFNKNADRTYRVALVVHYNNNEAKLATSPPPLGPALFHDLSDVESYTRLYWASLFENSPSIKYMDRTYPEDRFFWADSTFFDVFTVKFVEGNEKTALTQPNSVVMTESTALKYFGNADPMGKVIIMNKQTDYLVTGVIKDFPGNSHIHPDFLASISTLESSRSRNWLWNNYYTYLVLRRGDDLTGFKTEMQAEIHKYLAPQALSTIGIKMDSSGNNGGYVLQPLSSIHLESHLDWEMEANGDLAYVYIFSAIGVLILLVACINFVNLSTARSERRAKEVSVRKTLGSNRGQLVWQFLIESLLISMIAVVVSVGIVELLLPFLNGITAENARLNFLSDPLFPVFLASLILFVGIVAGIYPAFFLSSYGPAHVLKIAKRGNRKPILRDALVTFQFAISIVLLISTFVIYDQLHYVQNKKLGFNSDQVIVIKNAEYLGEQLHSFENELIGNPKIVSVSNSTGIPSQRTDETTYRMDGIPNQQMINLRQIFCDYNFAATYRIVLDQGRFLSREHPGDSNAVVVNQEVSKIFGVKNILGRQIQTPFTPFMAGKWQTYDVVGVLKDFNYESLHQKLHPLVFHLFPNNEWVGKFISVRLANGDFESTLSFIRQAWKKYAGDETFDYDFLNKDLEHLYVADQRAKEIVTVFSSLSILIACLGLLGLAAFVTEQRTKEIGIRKVLGASVPEIIALLSTQFVKWVVISNVIAWPLAYIIMDKWLQNFAYRTSINLWIFVASGIMALIIALLTVSSHAIKAATANPVESLRYE